MKKFLSITWIIILLISNVTFAATPPKVSKIVEVSNKYVVMVSSEKLVFSSIVQSANVFYVPATELLKKVGVLSNVKYNSKSKTLEFNFNNEKSKAKVGEGYLTIGDNFITTQVARVGEVIIIHNNKVYLPISFLTGFKPKTDYNVSNGKIEFYKKLTEEEKRAIEIDKKLPMLENDLKKGSVSMSLGLKKYMLSENDDRVIVLLNKLSKIVDYDKDGLTDYDEMYLYYTNTEKADSDGDGINDSDWNERREYNYSVHFNVRLVKPFDLAFADEHIGQDVKVIEETKEYADVELVVYPVNNLGKTFVGNKNWKKDNEAIMSEVKPGFMNDWDAKMQRDLVKLLKDNGIDPDTLSDKDLVIKTIEFLENNYVNKTYHSSPSTQVHMFDWYIKRNRTDGTYILNASGNNPSAVNADLQKAAADFTASTGQQWDTQRIIDTLASGKAMFYNRMHGSCSGTSEFYATIFQALGIPTKVMTQRTNIDFTARPNNCESLKSLRTQEIQAMSNKSISSYLSNTKTGSSHIINYIYIGNRWVDLDVASKSRFNTSALYDNYIRFFVSAGYDFTDDLESMTDAWLLRTHSEHEFNQLAVSKNFTNSKVNNFENSFGGLLLKIYNFTDLYGKNMSKASKDSLENLDIERPSSGYNYQIRLNPPRNLIIK